MPWKNNLKLFSCRSTRGNNYFPLLNVTKPMNLQKTMVQRHKAIKCTIMNLHTKCLCQKRENKPESINSDIRDVEF